MPAAEAKALLDKAFMARWRQPKTLLRDDHHLETLIRLLLIDDETLFDARLPVANFLKNLYVEVDRLHTLAGYRNSTH